ncbi:MAG: flagellar type III secretion system protein FlhB [Betaproteobacteria bacterium]|nr:flagellar type III secretion system protein FlhB [Betaproteobacteria bacterium]NBS47979.1 flagellar type III secretion system protein FlhB [Betaproteobacteria bacterium]
MDDSTQDRQLPASPRKLQKARDEGQIARSRDLGHLAVLGTGVAALVALSPWLFHGLQTLLTTQLRFDARITHDDALTAHAGQWLSAAMLAWLPVGLLAPLAAVVAAFAVGGWVLSATPITPDLSRLGLKQGLARLWSAQQLGETAKLVVLTGVMGVVALLLLHQLLPALAMQLRQSLPASLQTLSSSVVQAAWALLAVVLAVALLDAPLQQWLHRRRLRMSHQELREEFKETEGNPHNRQRQRQRAREIANRASIKAVPAADLVVMNPTHYAVALRYDERTMAAPRVVAKGADLLALRIRDIARQASVPVLQAPVLARALYAHAELNGEVPSALYTAVAQVLAHVYRLKAAMRGEISAPPAFEPPAVPAELDPHHERFRPPVRRSRHATGEGART